LSALESLRNADLKRTLAELQDEVRKQPSEVKHRVFLFQLLAVLGQWDRALTQLNVARELNASTLEMAQAYQEVLHCEVLRGQVFTGQRAPLFFGEPEPWLARIWEAQVLTGKGEFAAGQKLRDEAYEEAPTTSGKIYRRLPKTAEQDRAPHSSSGPPEVADDFTWLADADSRLGPILEIIVNGRYYWAPFHRIRRIVFDAPADLRDLVWLPAHFEWTNGGEMVGMVPTRYPGSESSDDDLIRLGRKTEWQEVAEGVYLGSGQRLLTTDAGDYSLLEIHRIEWDSPESPS